MTTATPPRVGEAVAVRAARPAEFDTVLTPGALAFVATLHRTFEPRQRELQRIRHPRGGVTTAGR